jgi:hypothetical protein
MRFSLRSRVGVGEAIAGDGAMAWWRRRSAPPVQPAQAGTVEPEMGFGAITILEMTPFDGGHGVSGDGTQEVYILADVELGQLMQRRGFRSVLTGPQIELLRPGSTWLCGQYVGQLHVRVIVVYNDDSDGYIELDHTDVRRAGS